MANDLLVSWCGLFTRFLLVVCCLTSGSTYLGAQSRNVELTGLVMDAQGAVIPGADVTVTNEATGVAIATKTNDTGSYRVGNLLPGPYRVEVSVSGFKSFVREGFTLQVAQIGRLDATLEVGDVTEQVTVTGEAPQLKTESAEALSHVVSQRELRRLPDPKRKWDSLIALSALAKSNSQAGWMHGQVSMAGTDSTVSSFYMNGAQANDFVGNMPIWGFSSEFVEEFSMVANGFSAEFTGPHAISVISKSGTNRFHGGANYFIQDDSLNANPWGASSLLPFRETEWGFALGGPIVKNKTHFFAGFQRVRSTRSSPAFLTIPTPLQIRGDFSQTLDAGGSLIPIYDPATTRSDPSNPGNFIRDPFPGNMITPARFDSVGSNILSFYPSPNLPGTITGATNFEAERKVLETTPQGNYRVDHQWNERHRTFGSHVLQTFVNANPSVYGVEGVSDVALQTTDTNGFIVNLGHTYVPNPTWVLDTSFMTTRFHGLFGSEGFDFGYPEQLGLTGMDPNDPFPTVSIAGFSPIGGGIVSEVRFESFDMLNWAQRFSHHRGRHTFKFGFEAMEMKIGVVIRIGISTLGFDPLATALPPGVGGNSVASVLLGQPIAGARDDGIFNARDIWYYAGYVQDEWKVRDNLTLNLGLRWETITPLVFRNRAGIPHGVFFDRQEINPVSGTPGIITFASDGSGPEGITEQSYKHFQPRLGLAWQPWGAGSRTVVRSGGGIYFTNLSGRGLQGQNETSVLGSFSSPDSGITPAFLLKDGFPAIPAGEPIGPAFGAVPVGAPPRFGVTHVDTQNFRQAYSIQYNFGIEQLLPADMVFSVQYLGNLGRGLGHVVQENQIHPSEFGPGNAQIRRPFPQFANVANGENSGASSSYHALELKVVKRFSHGLTFQSDYVFNKYLGSTSLWNAYDRGTARVMEDAQQRWITYAIWDLPWGSGRRWLKSGPMSRVVGGWIVTPIVRWQSGPFASITHIANTSNGFLQGNQGVTLIGDPNLSNSQRTMARWFDTGAFEAPAPFTLGNAGRSIVELPGSIAFDLGISKVTPINERASVEFKLELFNAFNHPNLGNPGTTLGAPNFGIISSKGVQTGQFGAVTLGSRRIQFGVRLRF